MKSRFSLMIVISLGILILSACSNSANTLQAANGKEYTYSQVAPDDGSFWLGGINLYTATSDELKSISEYDNSTNTSIDLSKITTIAATGANILSTIFHDWTETGSIVICKNQNADAWIIHGQLKDRYSAMDGVGIVAIDNASESVIAIAYGKSTT